MGEKMGAGAAIIGCPESRIETEGRGTGQRTGWRAVLFATTALVAVGLASGTTTRADQTIAGTTNVPPDIVETGVLTVTSTGILNINNTGTVQTQDLDVDGGTVNVENGGILTILGTKTTQNGGDVFVKSGGTLNAGQVNHQGNNLSVSGTMTSGDLVATGFLAFGNGGSYTVNGTAMFTGTEQSNVANPGAVLRVTGTMTVALSNNARIIVISGGTITAESDVFVMGTGSLEAGGDGTINVMGALTVSDSAEVESFATTSVFNVQGPIVIQDNGRVQTGSTGTGVFNAFGTTTVNGNGELRIFGVYNASLPVTLNGGRLIGADLFSGLGVLNGTVINVGGTVRPGINDGDTDILPISGTYDQRSGGTFLADVKANGDADQLAVTGVVKLAGNVTVNIVDPGMAAGTQVRILAATTAIEGMFDNGTLTGESIGELTALVLKADTAGAMSDTGNNIDVLFVSAGVPTSGLSGNQAAIAGALGQALPPGGIVVLNETTMLAVSVQSDPALLNQLSPEPYDSFTAFSFNLARQHGGLVDSRVRALRCAGSAGGQAGAFCSGGQSLFASDGRDPIQLADAGGRAGSGLKAADGAPSGTHPYGWSVWASGVGAGLWKDRTSDNLGYSGWTTGGVAGVDLALSRRFIIGVLAGGARSNIDFDGVSGDGDMESVTTGVYAAWYGRHFFANTSFTYTKNWVDADRDITAMGTTANGKTEGDQYAVHATLGAAFNVRRFSIEASGGVDWVKLRQYGFTETGAGALNLTVNSRTDDSLRLRVGVRVSRVWRLRPGLAIAPNLRVGYAREILDNTRPITATLAGVGGAFTVTGDEGGRDFLTYGGGVQAVWSQGVTVFVAYAGEWAKDRTASSFTGGIRISW